MKKILIISILLLAFNYANAAPPPIDTLLLLKTRIENNKNNFINKPFKVLTDTLKKLKIPIIEYSGAHDNFEVLYINDTIWVDGFVLFFEEYLGTKKMFTHHESLSNNKGIDTSNTHIKIIKVYFQTPKPFLRNWKFVIDQNNPEYNDIDGRTWSRKIASFYKDCIIKDLKVDEL